MLNSYAKTVERGLIEVEVVYSQTLKNLTTKLSSVSGEVPSRLVPYLNKLVLLINNFESKCALRRGQNIESIWRQLRTPIPRNGLNEDKIIKMHKRLQSTNHSLDFVDNNECQLLYQLHLEEAKLLLSFISTNAFKGRELTQTLNEPDVNNQTDSNLTSLGPDLKHFGIAFDLFAQTEELKTLVVSTELPPSCNSLSLYKLAGWPLGQIQLVFCTTLCQNNPEMVIKLSIRRTKEFFKCLWQTENKTTFTHRTGPTDLIRDASTLAYFKSIAALRSVPVSSLSSAKSLLQGLGVQLCRPAVHKEKDTMIYFAQLLGLGIQILCALHSSTFPQKVYVQLIDLLERHYIKLSTLKDFPSYAVRKQILSLMLKSNDAIFCFVTQKHFTHAIFFAPESDKKFDPFTVLGRGFLNLAMGSFELYVPDKPVDPASFSNAASQIQSEKLSFWSSQLQNRREYDFATFGHEVSPSIDILRSQLQDDTTAIALYAERHDQSGIQALWQTLNDFVEMVTSHSTRLEKSAAMLVDIIPSRIEQMQKKFADYSDILDPFSYFAYQLNLGISLIEYASRTQLSSKSYNPAQQLFDPQFLWSEACTMVKDSTNENLVSLLLSKVHQSVTLCDVSYDKFEEYESLVDEYVETLKFQEMRAKDDHEKKTALYKYRSLDDSENEKAELESLFPENADNLPRELAKSSNQIIDSYLKVMLVKNSEPFTELAVHISDFLVNHVDKFEELDDEKSFVYQIIAFSRLSLEINKSDQDSDFYHSANPSQLLEASNFASEVRIKVAELVQKTPENFVLLDIMKACEAVLRLPITVTLFTAIQKLEQMHIELDEWEKSASRDVSLSEELGMAKALIIQWRRIELKSWRSLLDREDRLNEVDSQKWWHKVYELCISTSRELAKMDMLTSNYISEMTRALIEFLQTSTYGQLSHRLQHLRALKYHVKWMSQALVQSTMVACALDNILSLFALYSNVVNEQSKEVRAKLEKDISEIILLATWKDANLHALQESSRQSHRKLLKVVQRYRAFLQQPVSSMIASGLPAMGTENCAMSPVSVNGQSVIPPLFASEHVGTNLEPANHKSQLLGVTIVSIAEDCRETMSLFRKETSKIDIKKDSSLLGQLRLRKHRALVDTMKLLAKIGYKLRPRFETIQSHMNITCLLMSTVSIGDMHAADNVFFRVLELLPRIREMASSNNGDLTAVEVSRGLGLCDSLVEALLEARRPIARFAEAAKCSKGLLESLRKISALRLQKSLVCGTPKMGQLESYTVTFRQLPAMVNFTLRMFDIYDSISEDKVAQPLKEGVHALNLSFSELSTGLAQSIAVCSSSDEANYNAARLQVRSALSWLQTNLCEPPLSFLASHLQSLLESLNRFGDLEYKVIEVSQRENIPLLSQSIASKMVRALHVLQMESKSLPAAVEEDGSMLRVAKFYTKAPEVVDISHLNQLLEELIAQFNCLTTRGVEETHYLSHAVFLLLPTAETFFETCTTLLHAMSIHHLESSRGTYDLLGCFFKLCSEGFCQPKEAESPSAKGEKQSGTGLGDAGAGAGADENISHDVADDEELSIGDAQSERGSLRADEDGVEMEDNFDAELEDIGEAEKQADQEKGSDESYSDQVDNVSNADENAVDDKLWNQENGDERPEQGDAVIADNVPAAEDDRKEPDLKQKDDTQHKQRQPPSSQQNHENGDDAEEHEDGESEQGSEPETQMPMDDTLPIDADIEESERFELPDLTLDDKSGSELDLDNQSHQDDLMSEAGTEVGEIDEKETKMSIDSEEHNENLSHHGDDGQDQTTNNPHEETDPTDNLDADMDMHEDGNGANEQENVLEQRATGPNGSKFASEVLEESKGASVDAAERPQEDGEGSSNPALQGGEGEGEERQQTRRSLTQTTEALHPHINSLAEASEHEDPSTKAGNDFEHVAEEDASNAQVMASADDSRVEGAVAAPFAQSQSHGASLQEDHQSNPRPVSPERTPNKEQAVTQMEVDTTNPVRHDWGFHERSTKDLSFVLCEQLRMILEPTLASRMQGDYRTGKRLNMRRIIPYIASEYKKDKIWLRRSKPSKRQYQVLVAIDDSRSMADSGCADLAFDTLALVAQAMAQLEVGEIGFLKFGEEAKVLHALGDPYTSDAGARIVEQFAFAEERTNVRNLLEQSVEVFQAANGRGDVWQLEIIISDGLCEDHDEIARILRRARESKILVVFAVLDRGDNPITQLKRVTWKGADMHMDRYLDTFPFEYYVVVRHIEELPHVLSSVLRQFFQLS